MVVHGGVGNRSDGEEPRDGCDSAAREGLSLLQQSEEALAAAVRAVVMLEDDERFNAGTGSIRRSDGSIEMDAAVMDSQGRLGAVCALQRVKNPVLVARRVVDTPPAAKRKGINAIELTRAVERVNAEFNDLVGRRIAKAIVCIRYRPNHVRTIL